VVRRGQDGSPELGADRQPLDVLHRARFEVWQHADDRVEAGRERRGVDAAGVLDGVAALVDVAMADDATASDREVRWRPSTRRSPRRGG